MASWWKNFLETDVEKQELMRNLVLSTKRQQWKGKKPQQTYYNQWETATPSLLKIPCIVPAHCQTRFTQQSILKQLQSLLFRSGKVLWVFLDEKFSQNNRSIFWRVGPESYFSYGKVLKLSIWAF